MKTRNVFTTTSTSILMEVFDMTGIETGEKLPEGTLPIASQVFDLTEEMLGDLETNKEDEPMSLAAYGLCRLMQDRNSGCSDKHYNREGFSLAEAVKARMLGYMDTYSLVARGRFNPEKAEAANKAGSISPSHILAFVYLIEGEKDVKLTEDQALVVLKKLGKEELTAMKEAMQPYMEAARATLKERSQAATASLGDLDLGSLLG